MNTLRQVLIRKISVDTAIPIGVVDDVITDQFQSAVEAVQTCMSVELSGFGKFVLRESIARKWLIIYAEKIIKWEELLKDESISHYRRRGAEGRIKKFKEGIELLKVKLHED